MKNRRNYYRILHVQPDAPTEVIRSSYRTMMHRLRMHPDLGGDAASAALINEAYETLADARNRDSYDRGRRHRGWARTAAEPAQYPTLPGAADQLRCAFCRSTNHRGRPGAHTLDLCRHCDSPLAPPRELAADEADRRVITRMPKQEPLSFYTMWPQPLPCAGRAADISLTGMRFCTPQFLGRKQLIKIDTQALKAVAKVVWSRPLDGEWEVAVHFRTLCFVRPLGAFVEERV